MNKPDFINLVAEKMGTTKTNAELAINGVFDALVDVMSEKDSYTHQGFGTFSAVYKEEHDSRNPKTGETVKVAAKYVPKFSFSDKIKKTIKES